jgi:putative CocE/NonD family hydrolase
MAGEQRCRTARRRATSALVATVAALALVTACAPPPLDLAGTDGPYGVTLTRNLEISLPDGRVLRADLYQPTDPATGDPAPGPFPVVIGFTPYGKHQAADAPNGADGVNLTLVRHGYLAAAVDVPGTGASDGAFDLFDHAEAVAGAGVVRWAATLPRSNGKVGMLGLSYMAIVQLFTAAEVGPASPLKAIFPMAATVDPYRDLFTSGGALNVLSPLGLLFGYGLTRSVTPFTELWDDPVAAVRHAAANFGQLGRFEAVMADDMFANGPRRYDGDWWRQRAPESVLQRIVDNGVAVHLVGGLHDVFQRGEPLLYSGLQNAWAGRPVDAPMSPDQPVTDRFQLLTGPWTHGRIGDGMDLTAVELAWFDRWLKDDPGADTGDPATPLHIIEPGGTRSDAATYPLADAHTTRLWLRGEHALATEAPTTAEPADTIDHLPIGPACTASTVQFAAGLFADCLKPAVRSATDPNEVTYATAPLDAPMRLAGPIGLSLTATSTTSDALFAVTLEDVAPDGTSTTITGGAQLGSLRALDPARSWIDELGGTIRPYLQLTRESRQKVPVGQPVTYSIEVRPAFATVPAGHRLRLRISSADFPHLLPLADAPSLLGGRSGILHGPGDPSFVDLSVRGLTPAGSHGDATERAKR